ncbi:putative quinol monooxygenase [Mariniflexile sp. AS56]|uniref:putative quinol monooxygenase n=1 Tax=Mariniflexile sp. AS56 TaxID=3063957 RepID=UPI0026E9268E|nr:antibiotic biosynthesis monooxygenase family protein [Mariniflexile sp. AS56]MDO7171177.1 antibiotic biosynthesis monooxygenase family protein [Mariniflexile sp. AS56]
MLIRIVKMGFDEANIATFLSNFDANKSAIRGFEGCLFLELYRDKTDTSIFFTYSYWKSESDLEHYRHSNLFKNVWAKTKPLFNRKPEAWSVDRVETLD